MVAQQTTIAPEGLYIPLDKIKDDMPNVRRDWGHAGGRQKLEELTESVRQHGVLQPIEVSPRGDGWYDVLVGHRRFEAARRAGLLSIPAVVRKTADDERSILQLVENLVRQDLSFIDTATVMQQLIDRHGLSYKELARMLNVSKGHVQDVIVAFRDPILRGAVQQGLIALSTASALYGLHKDYSAPLYAMLRAGSVVQESAVNAAREQQRCDGVTKDRQAENRGLRPVTLAKIETATRLRANGMGTADIAREMDVDTATVRTWIARHETAISFPVVDTPLLKDRVRNMRDQGSSVRQIAVTLGISLGTVNRLLFARPLDDADIDEPNQLDDAPSSLAVTVDSVTRLVVCAEPITTPDAPVPSAARTPLFMRAPDEPQERPAPMGVLPPHEPPRATEVRWCDLCAPFKGRADFERALVWAASRGMTAVEMLEQYRAACR